jgi:hypothetical protein
MPLEVGGALRLRLEAPAFAKATARQGGKRTEVRSQRAEGDFGFRIANFGFEKEFRIWGRAKISKRKGIRHRAQGAREEKVD